MPRLSFGDNIPSGGGRFVSLNKQGDAITFRLAGEPFFEFIHWMDGPDGNKERTPCVRLNNPDEGLDCPLCDAGDRAKSKFYYPILNRDTGRAAIFRTSASVHIAIDSEFRDGIDVFKYDYRVTRIGGEDPNKYYRVTRLPEPKPLSKDEEEQLEEAKLIDVASETGAPRKSSVSPDDFEKEMDELNQANENEEAESARKSK